MKKAITGACLLCGGAFMEGWDLLWEEDKIIGIAPTLAAMADVTVNGRGHFVMPGLLDMHIHGIKGGNVLDGAKGLITMIKALPAYGVTSFLPSIAACGEAKTQRILRDIAGLMAHPPQGARILGVHLEGPFLNPNRAGAIDPRFLTLPSQGAYERLTGDFSSIVKMVTLAPEQEGALPLAKTLHGQGVLVAMGHTEADYEVVQEAYLQGFTHSTHLFNGMLPMHHQKPGPVLGILQNSGITAELILDGVHVHPAMVKLCLQLKGVKNCVLVSDSIMAAGLEDGYYPALGEEMIMVKDGVARLLKGNLAGSTLTLDKAVQNAIALMRCTPAEAFSMATENPARRLGLPELGALYEGHPADFIMTDRQFHIVSTYIGGEKYLQE